jgi:DNA-binding response OmpR family regulator
MLESGFLAGNPPHAQFNTVLSMPSILIAEDDKTVLLILEHACRQAGYEVDTASEGAAAEKLLTTRAYDVVILDMVMPGFGGLELVQVARQLNPGKPYVMVISAMSSGSTYSDDELREQLDADVYMTKPVEAETVMGHVAALLEAPRPTAG